MRRNAGPDRRSVRRGGREGGFTLLEMMVVIIIVVILASVSVALLNVFFRGQGVRQGAMVVTNAVAQAKQKAAEKHRYFFLVFSAIGGGTNKEGWMEVHEDKNEDGIYQGDDKPDTVDADPAIEGGKVDLPKFVVFDQAPSWIAFSPSGYCHFNPGFKEIQASSFDKVMNGSSPTPVGDVILRIVGRGFVMCIDLDKAAGKVRRFFFLNEESAS